MTTGLTRDQVKILAQKAAESLPYEKCKTCECFQRFLTRLELDSQQDVSDITALWKVGPATVHECLGCAPCPPATVFADYLQENLQDSSSDQTL